MHYLLNLGPRSNLRTNCISRSPLQSLSNTLTTLRTTLWTSQVWRTRSCSTTSSARSKSVLTTKTSWWLGSGPLAFGSESSSFPSAPIRVVFYYSVDLHWIAKSSMLPFIFWMQLMYFYLEGRKSIFKPLLMTFYRKIAANECHNFDVYYHENIENKIRDLIRVSKSQLEYYQIH